MSLKKTLLTLVGVSLMLAVVAVPATAKADALSDAMAQLAILQAQIALLQNGGVATPGSVVGNFAKDLTVGSTGADVMALQKFLNSKGFTVSVTGAGSPGMESSYFGLATKAALAKYQAANGITPAAGYFGPITRANVNQMGGTVTPPGTTPGTPSTPGTGTLEGGAGAISEADFISGLNNEDVGEDEEDVQVAGLEIEADEGSDIRLTAVTLDFDRASSGTGSSDDLEDYASEVSVWFDGEEVARVDADTFDEDNDYSRTISLDSGAIIDAEETGKLIVAVSGISNLDSDDADEDWNVAFEGIRFVDGQGATVTDTSTGDITDGNNDTTTDAGEREFTFATFATASDVELQVSLGDEAINDSHVIDIHATDDTNNVEVLSFNVEAEGDSDINLDEVTVELTTVGFDVDDGISTATLWLDGEEIGSENITAGVDTDTDVVFDDLNLDISSGDEVEFIVKIDLKSIADGLVAGDTVTASTTASMYEAEDESGEDLAVADLTGAAAGDAHALYDEAMQVEFISDDSSTYAKAFTIDGDDNDYVEMTIVFDVTAFGGDVYIPTVLTDVSSSTSATGGAPTTAQGIGYHLQFTSAGIASTSVSETLTTTADEETNSYLVEEGQTERFTLKVTVTNAAAPANADSDQFRAILTGINFGDSDSATGDAVFTSDLQNTFRTGYVRMGN